MPAHRFRNKLLLNQWMMSLLGLDPLHEYQQSGRIVRPFHKLTDPIKSAQKGLVELFSILDFSLKLMYNKTV